MRTIPASLCEKAGILVPVQMTERAYDYIMNDTYLITTLESGDMSLALSGLMAGYSASGGTGARFSVPFTWGSKDFTYTIVDEEDGVVFMEVDLYRP